MSNPLHQAILDAADISAVSQLVLRERYSRDLGLWEQMRDCFHEDSTVRLSWINASGAEFVRRSEEMAKRDVNVAHKVSPILVALSGQRAIAQFTGAIRIPFTLNGIEVIVSSYSLFLFRAERREQTWRLSAFDMIYQYDEMATVTPSQAITIDPAVLKSFRSSYRLLSYCLTAGGFPVRNDLAGIDRPDLVEALMREIYGWAGLVPPR